MEARQPGQGPLFLGIEHVEGPRQSRIKTLVARTVSPRVPQSPRRQAAAQIFDGQHTDPRGRQLDGQRHAPQRPGDQLTQQGALRLGRRQPPAHPGGPVDKELDTGFFRQGGQGIETLLGQTQGQSAGDEQAEPGQRGQEMTTELSDGLDEALSTIEDQCPALLVGQALDEVRAGRSMVELSGPRHPECREDGVQQAIFVGDGLHVDDEDSTRRHGTPLHHVVGTAQRGSALSHPARTMQGDQPWLAQLQTQSCEQVGAAEVGTGLRRQVHGGRQDRRRCRDEAVATAIDRDEVLRVLDVDLKLGPQALNGGVDRPGTDPRRVAPHLLQQGVSVHELCVGRGQTQQERLLGWREVGRDLPPNHTAVGEVDVTIGQKQHLSGILHATSAKEDGGLCGGQTPDGRCT